MQPTGGSADASVFEALFLRGNTTSPELRKALKSIGVDLENLQGRYSSVTWTAALDLARAASMARGLSQEEAEHELGRQFTTGFLRTVSGRLLSEVLPLMTIGSLLSRASRYVSMGRDDMVIELHEHGPGQAKLTVTDPVTARPRFFLGMVEAALERVRTPFSLNLQVIDDQRFLVEVRWTEKS